jgi:hypothetical protein
MILVGVNRRLSVCTARVCVESTAQSGSARWVLESGAVRVSERHGMSLLLLCQQKKCDFCRRLKQV